MEFPPPPYDPHAETSFWVEKCLVGAPVSSISAGMT